MMTSSGPPGVPFVVLSEAFGGRPVAVNGLHVETIEEVPEGALITFRDGITVTVGESFGDVVAAFLGSRKNSRLR